MKKVVITGATSMLGISLIKECLLHNTEVLAVVAVNSTKISAIPEDKRIQILQADLDGYDAIDIQNYSRDYDVFFHFAWAGGDDRYSMLSQKKNIDYNIMAMKLAHQLGCRKFFFPGSQAEYGKVSGAINELTRPEPQIAYGIAKLSAGLIGKKLCEEYGMLHIWGRIFSIYGPNDRQSAMIMQAVRAYIKHEKMQFSAATQMWDYLYQDDFARMVYRLAERVEQSDIFCIGSEKPRPLKHYIYDIKKVFPDFEFELDQEKTVDSDDRVVGICPDVSKLISIVGVRPEVEFEEGIDRIYKHLLNKGEPL